MNHNAQAVVDTWRANKHAHVWSEPARSMTPSAVTYTVARVWAEIGAEINLQADDLAKLGFQPGLPLMRELRGLASQAMQSSQRATKWADDLLEAET